MLPHVAVGRVLQTEDAVTPRKFDLLRKCLQRGGLGGAGRGRMEGRRVCGGRKGDNSHARGGCLSCFVFLYCLLRTV